MENEECKIKKAIAKSQEPELDSGYCLMPIAYWLV